MTQSQFLQTLGSAQLQPFLSLLHQWMCFCQSYQCLAMLVKGIKGLTSLQWTLGPFFQMLNPKDNTFLVWYKIFTETLRTSVEKDRWRSLISASSRSPPLTSSISAIKLSTGSTSLLHLLPFAHINFLVSSSWTRCSQKLFQDRTQSEKVRLVKIWDWCPD